MRGARLRYWWDGFIEPAQNYDLFPGHRLLIAGLCGRSGRHVVQILMSKKATDDDLRLIGARFQNIQDLQLDGSDISGEGLAALRRCRRLQFLSLGCTDIGDQDISFLIDLPELWDLTLERTLISEASIPIFESMNSLKQVNIEWTAAASFVAKESRSVDHTKPESAIRITHPPGIFASIRWSDGHRSSHFDGDREFWIEGPLSLDPPPVLRNYSYYLEEENLFWWSVASLSSLTDGDYRFRLKLEGVEAEPIDIQIKDGIPSVNCIEFRMPVTKAKALQGITE